MENNIANELAENILNKLNEEVKDNDKFGIDPITIIMIVAILVNVIRVIQECRKEKVKSFGSSKEKNEYLTTEVRFLSFNHSWLTRRRIKNILKKNMTSEQFNKYGNALLKILLEEGKTISEEQIEALLVM